MERVWIFKRISLIGISKSILRLTQKSKFHPLTGVTRVKGYLRTRIEVWFQPLGNLWFLGSPSVKLAVSVKKPWKIVWTRSPKFEEVLFKSYLTSNILMILELTLKTYFLVMTIQRIRNFFLPRIKSSLVFF